MARGDGTGLTRRGVLAAMGAAGIGAVSAACGGGGGDPGRSGGSGPVTLPAARVPLGSAVVVDQVVVSQPSQGEFKAFSAVCTHQSCLVTRVDQDTVECPCHGSLFSTADGSALRGPAQASLPARSVTLTGDTLVVS